MTILIPSFHYFTHSRFFLLYLPLVFITILTLSFITILTLGFITILTLDFYHYAYSRFYFYTYSGFQGLYDRWKESLTENSHINCCHLQTARKTETSEHCSVFYPAWAWWRIVQRSGISPSHHALKSVLQRTKLRSNIAEFFSVFLKPYFLNPFTGGRKLPGAF